MLVVSRTADSAFTTEFKDKTCEARKDSTIVRLENFILLIIVVNREIPINRNTKKVRWPKQEMHFNPKNKHKFSTFKC